VWGSTTGGGVDSSPAVFGGVVYVGSRDHKVYALNATTGTPKWTYATGNNVEYSSPAVAGGVVYVGSDDDKIYALNASTGTLVWSYATGGYVQSSPTVANGVVFVGSWDGKVYAFGVHHVAANPVVHGSGIFCPLHSCYAFAPAVGRGFSDIINFTVSNNGSYTEKFSVTFYANASTITTQTVTLAFGASKTVTLDWNTTGFVLGNYTINASVTLAPGETNIWTGQFTHGTVQITKVGDLGSASASPPFYQFGVFDGKVNSADTTMYILCLRGEAPAQWEYLGDLGSPSPNSPYYQFFKCDGKVNSADTTMFILCLRGEGP
jgi:hypothetical protein